MTQSILVAVDVPKWPSYYSYNFQKDYEKGDIVKVPFGNKNRFGIICEIQKNIQSNFKLRDIESLNHLIPRLDSKTYSLIQWVCTYYHYPFGKGVFDILPKLVQKKIKKKDFTTISKSTDISLKGKMNEVYEKIDLNTPDRYLVHGVTGSGKTFLYAKLIEDILESGKSVQLLVPEIGLTPQMIRFFEEKLSREILCYHGSLSNGQKLTCWDAVQSEEPQLVIGVRSSVFLPMSNLGLIIVDEEHDKSFKQDDRLPYNARDVAILKGKIYKVPVLLGSATPSIESLNFHFQREKKNYYYIGERYGNTKLPEIKIVDLKNKENEWPITNKSLEEIQVTLDKRQKVIIYLNRKGYSNFYLCSSCGYNFECKDCSVNLKVYKKSNLLKCTLCSYSTKIPTSCPKCGCLDFFNKGYGTEKIVEVLLSHYPNNSIQQFDREVLGSQKKVEETILKFQDGSIDILVGTQMISKGHNFHNVGLVVILGIDQLLHGANFRGRELMMQSLLQVSGRAGRFGGESTVLIESFSNDEELVPFILKSDYTSFALKEIETRKLFELPPFSKMVILYLWSKNKQQLDISATEVYTLLKKICKSKFELSLPRETITQKRIQHFGMMILLKSQNFLYMQQCFLELERQLHLHSSVRIKIEVDPIDIL